MKGALLVLLASLTPALCRAAGKNTRTMADLRAIAWKTGESGHVGPQTANALGLPLPPRVIAKREIWFDHGITPDGGLGHAFDALVDHDMHLESIWTVGTSTLTAEGKMTDSNQFLVSTSGNLIAACHCHGIVGQIECSAVSKGQAKQRFKSERRFWTQESSKYQFSK